MKTKLTLTVHKRAIANAKRYSRKTGKSISKMFEELFEEEKMGSLRSEPQKAAERLLERLKSAPSIKTLDDRQLLKTYVADKFA